MWHRLHGAETAAHLSAVTVRPLTSDRFRAPAPKLGLRDRVQAVIFSYECGLVRAGA